MTSPLIAAVVINGHHGVDESFYLNFEKFRDEPREIRTDTLQYLFAVASGREARDNSKLDAMAGMYTARIADAAVTTLTASGVTAANPEQLYLASEEHMLYERQAQRTQAAELLTGMMAGDRKMRRWANNRFDNFITNRLETPAGRMNWYNLTGSEDAFPTMRTFFDTDDSESVQQKVGDQKTSAIELAIAGLQQPVAASIENILSGMNVFYDNAVRVFPDLADAEAPGPRALDIANRS